jgi:hypothetical protein
MQSTREVRSSSLNLNRLLDTTASRSQSMIRKYNAASKTGETRPDQSGMAILITDLSRKSLTREKTRLPLRFN